MRFVSFMHDGQAGLAVALPNGELRGALAGSPAYPGSLDSLIARQAPLAEVGRALAAGDALDPGRIQYLPVLSGERSKIICVGLNYRDHSAESGFALPEHPTLFVRFASSLLGHGQVLRRPPESTQFDYEGELVAVIGQGGRRIARDRALQHVVGYSIFNDASIRDFQLRTPQWTIGKNFDGTGPFGPYLVTADELPPGATGLRLQTRLNGQVVQDASTQDLVFDVATLVSLISEAMTLNPGDIIVTGTPAGVGLARKPPLYMAHGDVCEVEIEGLGVLSNRVEDERL